VVIDGGVNSVEHGFFAREDQLARMRDRQIAWVPTFAPVQAQVMHAARLGWDDRIVTGLRGILDGHASSLAAAHARGVPIVAGSDAGSYGVSHGLGLFDELELMERAGLPPLAVINAATGTSARHLAYKDPLGCIQPGASSRFILTRHSPLESVANLRRPRTVVVDGAAFTADCSADVASL
jgi:imidazolonepropionase-like amidohydrolase